MNYEASPFQDYESITIDELKDQANSLLNLVTDEQRPLRVCMNNGKEFLLFPQDLLAPICDSDFRLILLSAMRYAMGRNTCMPAVVSDYIKRTFGFWTISFLRWLPMIFGGTSKTTQSMSRIQIFGKAFLMHSKQSRECVPLVRQGRLGLARPAGSPRFEWQSKNIHDKITRKVNNVFLAGRRYFPLLRVGFPLKCPSNYGNTIVIEGKRVLSSESKACGYFFVYSGSTFELLSSQKTTCITPCSELQYRPHSNEKRFPSGIGESSPETGREAFLTT